MSGIIIGQRPNPPLAMPSGTLPQAFRLSTKRIPNEFYPTPPAATRALLSVETFAGSIWEPACGEGAIAQVLADAGHKVVATDLVDYGYGIGDVDFLKETRPRAMHIVTNPPYGSGLADAFITKALAFAAETRGSVAMLLNLASLAHRTRTRWWQEHPPARLYAIDDIVCWPEHRYGPAPSHFTKHRYVWAVWTPKHQGPSAFWWLSSAEFGPRQSRPLPSHTERKHPLPLRPKGAIDCDGLQCLPRASRGPCGPARRAPQRAAGHLLALRSRLPQQ